MQINNKIKVQRGSYTVKEFAHRHAVDKSTVYRWFKEGKLDSLKIGKTRRISVEQEERFVKQHEVKPDDTIH